MSIDKPRNLLEKARAATRAANERAKQAYQRAMAAFQAFGADARVGRSRPAGWRRGEERYVPHQGERECARRRRQLAQGQLSYREVPMKDAS